jgi:hypothetical protein
MAKPSSNDPDRRAINSHLWNYHEQATAKGDKFDRLAYHEALHAEGNDQGYAGDPPHRHEPGTHERMGGVVLLEGEGT